MPSRGLAGIFRSLRIYYGDPVRAARMDRLYRRFLCGGDLAFDIGAHVGDRTASFRRLGARVVALEPQPLCGRVLRLLYGRDPMVAVVGAAAGEHRGRIVLHVNQANPTVSTAANEFIAAADGAIGWEGQTWDTRIAVDVVTLDRLIATYGEPRFVKIDVEGMELAVLRGLTYRVPALSFEFTTIQRHVALACMERLAALGAYRFDAALGESQRLEFGAPVAAERLSAWLRALPPEANSGDVYAMLDDG